MHNVAHPFLKEEKNCQVSNINQALNIEKEKRSEVLLIFLLIQLKKYYFLFKAIHFETVLTVLGRGKGESCAADGRKSGQEEILFSKKINCCHLSGSPFVGCPF